MKKIQVTLVTLLLTGASLCAQTIGEKELNDIKGSFQKDASTKAIQNVLTNDKNIRDNALNRGNSRKNRPLFQISGKSTGYHGAAKFRTLLDVYLHERVTP